MSGQMFDKIGSVLRPLWFVRNFTGTHAHAVSIR